MCGSAARVFLTMTAAGQLASEIVPGLWVGGWRAAQRELNGGVEYDLIVTCRTESECPHTYDCAAPQVRRIAVRDDPLDGPRLLAILQETDVLDDVDRTLAGGVGRVLVHCAMGVQRSAAVAACFLMRHRGHTPLSAVALVRRRRPEAFFCRITFADVLRAFGAACSRSF